MPRPKTKQELLYLSQENYTKLMNLVASYSNEKELLEFPKEYLNRNSRDVLAHLHHWHLMLLEWYKTGMEGDNPDMPAKGYTWKTLPDLNRAIWKMYTTTPMEETKGLLQKSFEAVQEIIKSHSEKELFEKKRFKWTGTTSLAAYLISATSSHYDWAHKLIKKCTK